MFTNGKTWLDTDGNPIHAHGGWMLRHDGFWYWYGEDRRGDSYVSCYRSRDLHSWENRGAVLTAHSRCEKMRVRSDLTLLRPADEVSPDSAQRNLSVCVGRKVNIERPKVLYCAETHQFVMWAHYENGIDYHCAAACIATCDTPDGDFVYRGSFNPFGNMSRDCTVFTDGNGDAYFLSASRGNADMKIYRLTADYMNTDEEVRTVFQGEYREAPAVFRRNGKYYMLSSFCTGWAPNQGKYSVSDAMDGRWSILRDFGDETTYRSQPAFVLPLEDGRYIYVGDRWGGKGDAYFTSTYVMLELHFDADGNLTMEYSDESAL